MNQWQPRRDDPNWRSNSRQGQFGQPQYPPQQQPYGHQQPQGYSPPAAQPARKAALGTAEGFWYIMECVAFGAGYLCKVPAKKALQDFGMAQMTAAEQFWYVLMCICFGGGYFAKLPISKALSEMPQFQAARYPAGSIRTS